MEGLGETMKRTLETMKGLYLSGYFADDTQSDGETFREVVEGLGALDDILPAPHTTAPMLVRRLCSLCRGWYDGTPSSVVCPFCQETVDSIERSTIERNRSRPPTLCTLCGAESRTFVCEACDKRDRPFSYNFQQRAAGLPATGDDFCEDCGARLRADFDNCAVCEGVGPGGYCLKCGTRKVPQMGMAGIPLKCPYCG